MNVHSEFVGAFLAEFRPRVLPIYLTLAFLIGWIGLLSVRVLFEPTDMAAATVFANRVRLAMLAVIATPFAQPLAIVSTRRLLEGEG